MNNNIKTTINLCAAATLTVALSACDSQPPATGGEALFKKKCATCHALTPGKHGVGPSLAGVIGRSAGSTNFTKYKALRDVDFVWTQETLNAWIADPKAFIKKPTAMTVKVKTQEDRDQILDYLEKSGGRANQP
ncbi:c-type cytochrome [Pseudomonadota bacterium]